MKKIKSLILVSILVLSVLTDFGVSLGTVSAFAEEVENVTLDEEASGSESYVSDVVPSTTSGEEVYSETTEESQNNSTDIETVISENTTTSSQMIPKQESRTSASVEDESSTTENTTQKIKIARVGERDITSITAASSLPKDSTGKPTILKTANLTNNGTEENPLVIGDKLIINYEFDIPQSLYREFESGDFFDFDLPVSSLIGVFVDSTIGKSQPLKDQTGKQHGTFIINSNGHVRITFDDADLNTSGIKGNISTLLQINQNSNEISGKKEVAFTQVSKDVTSGITYVKSKEKEVTHQYVNQEILASGYTNLNWKTTLNPNRKNLSQTTMKQMLQGTSGDTQLKELQVSKIMKADVSIDGEVIRETESVPINLSSDGSVILPSNNGESYVIYTSTTVPFGLQMTLTSKISWLNGKEETDTVEQKVTSANLLEKKATTKQYVANQPLEWEITYNPKNILIPKEEAVLVDTINSTNHTLDESSINVAGNTPYKITTTSKGFTITFEQNVTQPIKITYQTVFKQTANSDATNMAKTGSQTSSASIKVPADVADVDSQITKEGSLLGNTASWTIVVNKQKSASAITPNLEDVVIEDTLDAGTIVNKTIDLKENNGGSSDNSFSANVSTNRYTVEWKENAKGETIGFKVHIFNAGAKAFQIKYTSDISELPYTNDKREVNNVADYYYSPAKEGTSPKHITKKLMDQKIIPVNSMEGIYLPETNEIEWSSYVNLDHQSLGTNGVLTLTIPHDQELVDGSMIAEQRLSKTAKFDTDANTKLNYDSSSRTITAKFPVNPIIKTYAKKITYRTTFSNPPNGITSYEGKSSYQDFYNAGIEELASVTPHPVNATFLKKTGRLDVVTNKINWTVKINDNQLDLQNWQLTDNQWKQLKIDRASIDLIEYNEITGLSASLKEGQDYVLIFTERYFEIRMLKNTETNKLTLNYESQPVYPVNALGQPFEMSNSVAMLASNVDLSESEGITTTVKGTVPATEGGVATKTANLVVTKTDEENPTKLLSEVEFTLYRGDKVDDNKIVDIKKTDDKGQIIFDDLTLDQYLLVETMTPNGYIPDLEGTKVNLMKVLPDDNTERVTISNKAYQNVTMDIPVKVIFKGVPKTVTTPDVIAVLKGDLGFNKSETLNHENAYGSQFTNVPKYTAEGIELKYTLSTNAITNYQSKVTGNATEGFTITYTYDEKKNVVGEIYWDDNQDKFNHRPSQVEASLYRNNQKIDQPAVVTEDNNGRWQYEFNNQAVYDSQGEAYDYQVEFTNVSLYQQNPVSGEPFSVTYYYRNTETFDKKGTIYWDDYNNKFETRPTNVLIKILQNEQEYKTLVVTGKPTESQWEGEFNGLPKYDDQGNLYRYVIQQELASDTVYQSKIDGTVIRNSYINQEKMTLNLMAIWDDHQNNANSRPGSLKVKVSQNGKAYREVSLNSNENWELKLTDLPKYDEEGNLYSYQANQETLTNYTFSRVLSVKNQVSFYNRYRNTSTIDIAGDITLDDYHNKFGLRPEKLTLEVYQNNGNSPVASKEVVIAEGNLVDGILPFEFKDLKAVNDTTQEAYQYDIRIKAEDMTTLTSQQYQVTSESEGRFINLSYKNEAKTKVIGKKIWDDYHNQFKLRPEEIKVDLFQNGSFLKTLILNTADQTKDTFVFPENVLPRYDKIGNPYQYSVVENTIDQGGLSALNDYQVSYQISSNVGVVDPFNDIYHDIIVTNTYRNTETKSIQITKKWDDYQNKFETRPHDINFNLIYHDGANLVTDQVKMSKPLTNEEIWTKTVDNLKVYDDKGQVIHYELEEEVPEDYQVKIDPVNTMVFTNQYRNDSKKDIKITIDWQDEQDKLGKRPAAVLVKLNQNGEWYEEEVLNKNNGYEMGFNNLPEFDEYGNEYVYTLEQEKDAHYEIVNVTDLEKPSKSVVIKNKYINQEKTSFIGSIQWIDKMNALGKRPNSVNLKLYQKDYNGHVVGSKAFKEETVVYQSMGVENNQEMWFFDFDLLPKYDQKLNPYQYEVIQESLSLYDSQVSNNKIINQYTYPEMTSIGGKVTWDDYQNKFETRPKEIKAQLLSENQLLEEVIVDTNRNYHFSPVNEYNKKGDIIDYSVQLIGIPSVYTTKEDGFNFINTYKNEETIDISGEIKWDDYDDKFKTRPGSVVVKLNQETQVVNPTSKWRYTFSDLPKYDVKGEVIKYETELESFNSAYTIDQTGNDFTNTYRNTETTSLSGTVYWEDYDNKFNTRPNQGEIVLFANGKLRTTILTDEKQNWTYSFPKLPKYDEKGELVTYQSQMEQESPYVMQQSGNDFIHTYHRDEKKTLTMTIRWEDELNKLNVRPDGIKVLLYQNNQLYQEFTPESKEDELSFTVEVPVYDELGEVYHYSVEQEGVLGYQTTLDEDNALNHFVLTNSYQNQENVTIKGQILWQLEKNTKEMPDYVIVELYELATLKRTSEVEPIESQRIYPDKKGNWYYEFTDLSKYDNRLNPRMYYVKQRAIKGFETTYQDYDIINSQIKESVLPPKEEEDSGKDNSEDEETTPNKEDELSKEDSKEVKKTLEKQTPKKEQTNKKLLQTSEKIQPNLIYVGASMISVVLSVFIFRMRRKEE